MGKTFIAVLVLMLALAACAKETKESKFEDLTQAVEEMKKAADCTNLVTPYDFAAQCITSANISLGTAPQKHAQVCELLLISKSDAGTDLLRVLLRKYDSYGAAATAYTNAIDGLKQEGASVNIENDVGESSIYAEGKGQRMIFFVQLANVVLLATETGTPAMSFACSQENLTALARIVSQKI